MGKSDKEFGSQVNLIQNDNHSKSRHPNDVGGHKPTTNSTKRSTRQNSIEFETIRPEQKILTADEKLFLLNTERGDLSAVKRIITALSGKRNIFDINCVDPLGRSGLIIAIENENIEMLQFLLESGIEPKDGLLIAIREDYVDGVECLLRFEEETHKPGTSYTWESIDQVTANFTPDITPLVLAAQRNNYEILKMLLDRGASIPVPHDVKCGCDECLEANRDDSLRFSLSRINAYKALASPSLICLSSKDPILTAFELSEELKRLSRMEAQFRDEYCKLRKQVQELANGLIDHARTSYELEILLNHNPDGEPWTPGQHQTLHRLQIAIDTNQKQFVTHASVQQLLAAIWYDGLPGFRRLHFVRQVFCVMKHACMFPIYSMLYMLAPYSELGKFSKKPFVKFICHSASYIFFLLLLALASQRVEMLLIDAIVFMFPDTTPALWLADVKAYWEKHERGSLPSFVEMAVIIWVQGLIWKEMKNLYKEGFLDYLMNMWNLADVFSYGSFMGWISLRTLSFLMVQKEQYWDELPPEEIWIPRDQWLPFDPFLLAEGMFGAGMISSYLKLVHIFSINPYLGPLQVSLGKMIIDIFKWMVMYILVLFAFGCGLNQLLWYYADLERQECYSLPGGLPDLENAKDSCVTWRRFANLWETSQSLFWASFGLVDLADFELKGIKEFTRFWGLLMFGSYSVCNIIVLLNMLIAMMSNSYTKISDKSDIAWKFARSKLWISYFDEGATVPPPFNMIPTPKAFARIFLCKKKKAVKASDEDRKTAESKYYGVVRCLVRRYVTNEQRKSQNFNITEDDINEVRQDIRSFRYELINILRMNNMKTPNLKEGGGAIGRKAKDLERMIQKGFQITKIESVMQNVFAAASTGNKSKDIFRKLAKAAIHSEKKDWNTVVRNSSIKADPIGSTQTSVRRHNKSLRRSLLARGNSKEMADTICLKELTSDELVTYNPRLASFTPTTRIAYARFKSNLRENVKLDEEDEFLAEDETSAGMTSRARKTPVKYSVQNETSSQSTTSQPKSSGHKPPRSPRVGGKDSPSFAKSSPEPAGVPEQDIHSDEQILNEVKTVREPLEVEGQELVVLSPRAIPDSPGKSIQASENILLTLDVTKLEGKSQESPRPSTPVLDESKNPDDIKSDSDEDNTREGPRFDPKGKSVSTGKSITGWL